MLPVLAYSLIAGLSIPFGAWIARLDFVMSDWRRLEMRHTIIAFGGGGLLSAVALVLVPDGIAAVSPWTALLSFILGAVVMKFVDTAIARSGSRKAQLLAMMADFVPEAIAMGALFASKPQAAPVLALLIAVQNVPEAFNAYHESRENPLESEEGLIRSFSLLALAGPACALAGYVFLSDQPALTGAMMCAAAGGILFLVFQDIAPEVRLEHSDRPPMGAVAGFALGLAGTLFLGE